MAFKAPIRADALETPQLPQDAGLFSRLMSALGNPTSAALQGSPFAAGAMLAGAAGKAPAAARWLTDRIVGGGSMLSGPVSKITQVPVKDIMVRALDHPDAINPLKVNEIKGLMSSAPSRLPAIELVEQGGKFYLKDGRHRFTAASELGFPSVPAIIQRQR